MRPLPRLHALTDARVLALDDFGVRAAAIAAAGPATALCARDRHAPARVLARAGERIRALARPPEAAFFVAGRPDLAAALGADGVQLAGDDLLPADARRLLPHGWMGRSVHTEEEAAAAVEEGADYLVVGNVYLTATHPGRPARGLDLVRRTAGLGRPVIAVGGITAARAAEVRDAGAWGAAAIGALWDAADPAAAALALLAPWSDDP